MVIFQEVLIRCTWRQDDFNLFNRFKSPAMKKSVFLVLMLAAKLCSGQQPAAPTLKSVLVQQLKNTHNQKEWYVPVNTAVEGLSAEQASWKDSSGNHSIAQLVTHLLFWNARLLDKFNGIKVDTSDVKNDDTFSAVDKKTWDDAVQKLDKVLTQLEKAVEAADESKLKSWYATIANVSIHNAYHTGQIIYIRKLQKSWDPDKGVK